MFQALPAFFILLLAPLATACGCISGAAAVNPSAATKFSLALVQIELAFLALTLGLNITEPGTKVALGWFVLNLFLLTSGEPCLAPVGMSMATKLAPQRIVGVMMGALFLAYSASSYLSGLIAQFTSQDGPTSSSAAAMSIYADVYTRLGIVALGLALLPFRPRMNLHHCLD